MKICFYTDRSFPGIGGAQRVLHHLATELSRRGHTMLVLAPYHPASLPHDPQSYPIYRYPKSISRRFGVRQTLLNLAWLYWRHRFDVLHCHSGYPPAYVGATFKRWFGVPLVVRPYGGDDIRPGGRTRRHPRLERRLRHALATADAVVAQGRFIRDIILELGVPAHRTHTLHNGVDLATFTTGEPFPHPRPYMLGLGGLIHHKGFDILLRAYAHLRQPAPDLLIAGAGPDRAALEQLAQRLGIAPRVTFLGLVEGQVKVNLLRSAMFLVAPARRETFSNVILEALAAGLPVVASAVGGNPELVHDGQHGLLFPGEDEAALTHILHCLITTPALLSQLRAAIPAFVQSFDWPLVAERYLTLYHALIAQRP